MKRLLFIPILLICSICSAQSISSVSGTYSEDESVVISGSSFGAHADYSEASYSGGLNAMFTDWDDAETVEVEGMEIAGDRQIEWYLSDSGNRVGSTKSAVRQYNSSEEAALEFTQSNNDNNEWYVSFWININEYNRGGKFLRAAGNDYGGGDWKNWWLATLGEATYNYNLRGFSEAVGGATQSTSVIDFTDNTWYFVEVWVSEVEDVAKTYINNTLCWTATDWFDEESFSANTHKFSLSGTTNAEWRDHPVDATQALWIYDDYYVSYTQARVVLGDNATYSNCTHLEIQIPTSWSDTSVTATINQGSFTDGDTAYLFVVDSSGTASDGYEIIIGGETTIQTQGNITFSGNITLGS